MLLERLKKATSFEAAPREVFSTEPPPPQPPPALPLSAQHAGRQAQHDARGGGEVDRQPHSQRQARRQDRLQTGEAPLIHLSHLSLISSKSHCINKKKNVLLIMSASALSFPGIYLPDRPDWIINTMQNVFSPGSRGDGQQRRVAVPAGD